MQDALLYGLTVLIWGSTFLAIKFQLGTVAPELSIAYRFGLAAALLLGYSLARRLQLRFSRREHALMALQGLLLFSVNYLLVYLSELYLTSGLVAVIFSTVIIMNVFFGALLLGNPVRARVVVGAVFGLAGLALVFWPELADFDLSNASILGLGMALASVVSASLGNITSAYNQRWGLPVLQTNAYGMAYGTAVMIVLALARGVEVTFDPSPAYVGSLVYLALFGSVVAFGAYLTLLGRIGPDRAAYVAVLFPVLALALSTLFEGLEWSLLGILGVLLVLVGNAVAVTRVVALRRLGEWVVGGEAASRGTP